MEVFVYETAGGMLEETVLSFERRPRPPWRDSNSGLLSKERLVIFV
jgi:hypothetical protein